MKEVFKPFKLDKNYLIGNNGTVKTFYKPYATKKNDVRGKASPLLKKARVLKPTEQHYYKVNMVGKTRLVHVMVAEHFVKGKSKKRYQVNHKDGNRLNNNYKNLEWVSASENAHHAFKIGLNSKEKIRSNTSIAMQRDEIVKKSQYRGVWVIENEEFKSLNEAQECLQIPRGKIRFYCLNNNYPNCYYRYSDNTIQAKTIFPKRNEKKRVTRKDN